MWLPKLCLPDKDPKNIKSSLPPMLVPGWSRRLHRECQLQKGRESYVRTGLGLTLALVNFFSHEAFRDGCPSSLCEESLWWWWWTTTGRLEDESPSDLPDDPDDS